MFKVFFNDISYMYVYDTLVVSIMAYAMSNVHGLVGSLCSGLYALRIKKWTEAAASDL